MQWLSLVGICRSRLQQNIINHLILPTFHLLIEFLDVDYPNVDMTINDAVQLNAPSLGDVTLEEIMLHEVPPSILRVHSAAILAIELLVGS